MDVSVRFLTVAAVAALFAVAAPLAAQSATQSALPDMAAATAPIAPVSPSALGTGGERALLVDPRVGSASDSAAATVRRGPTMASARVASQPVVSTTSRNAPPVLQNRTTNRNAVALMIVGGAALVVGAVIGDDPGTLVMLGGAAIGLWGLYLFLT